MSTKIKVLLVQYNPKFKDVESNIATLEKLLSQYTKKSKIDIIVFPEMALSGYIFEDLKDIEPTLSYFDKGIQYDFASNLAKRLRCHVFLGYPEKTYDNKYYNSCMIITPEGKSLPSYHKHFLYKDDKTWCMEGEDFGYVEIKIRSGKTLKLGIGICMDINPHEFTAPWKKMEFANFCLKNDVDLIIFPTAWTDSNPGNDDIQYTLEMIDYWNSRMEPYTKRKIKKNVYLLCADRIGKEKDTTFIGVSCAVKLSPNLEILKFFGKKDEGCLLVNLDI